MAYSQHSPAVIDQEAHTLSFLSFRVGGELFATPIFSVREIIEPPHITEIPLTPHFLRGVMNLRGAIVPVIDLAARFGRAAVNHTETSESALRACIIIAEVRTAKGVQALGAWVDSAEDVIDALPEALEAQPEFGASVRQDFVFGMLAIDDELVLVLDFDKVFSPMELERLMEASVHPTSVSLSAPWSI